MWRARHLSLLLLLCLAAEASAAQFTRLYSFASSGADGASPSAGLTAIGSTLYGTTLMGGANSNGTIFSISSDGTGFTRLYSFNAGNGVNGGLKAITAIGSRLYGTNNGTDITDPTSNGTVFALNPNGSNFGVLHSFTGLNNGGSPIGNLVASSDSFTFYGLAANGGQFGTSVNGGTLYRINADGSNIDVVHSFNPSTDGSVFQFGSSASLLRVGDVLYGTTPTGGPSDAGTVFSVNTDGSNFQVLHSFTGLLDGGRPISGLTLAGDKVFGTTFSGGAFANGGTLFSFDTDGSDFEVVRSLNSSTDGKNPMGSLILVGSKLYGSATVGGPGSGGTVFSLDPNNGSFEIQHAFGGLFVDGTAPRGTMTHIGSTLYGAGGDVFPGKGAIFAIAVPEPGTIVLGAIGGILLLVRLANRKLRSR